MIRNNLNITCCQKYLRLSLVKIALLSVLLSLPGTANAKTNSPSHVDVDSLIAKLSALNVDTYSWSIEQTNDWIDLSTFLPKAKMAGITINVSILPPSKTPPICPLCNYSEPYRLDFITWAKEIAKLSLRYSNIISYSINDLQENLTLGYLSQDYLNQIITAGKSINPKLQFINTSKPTYKIWYVDKDAKGNGTGYDWTNASTTVAGLSWASITGGDTVYTSGGSVSKTYTYTLIPRSSGKADRKIIITKGKDAGHNGEAIFDATGESYALYMTSINYTEISFLTFQNAISYVIGISNCIGIDILHCNIVHPSSVGVAYDNSYEGRFMYNTVQTGEVNTTAETDGMSFGIAGNIEIAHNTFLDANSNSAPHKDIFQSLYGFGNGGINKIHHNFIMQNDTANSQACLYLPGIQGYWEIHNNIIVNRGTDFSSLIQLGNQSNTTLPIYAKIYENTLVGINNNYPIYVSNSDSLDVRNNVIYKPTGYKGIDLQGSNHYVDIDYNEYYLSTTSNHARINTSWYTFGQWQALGYDQHGRTGIINFTNVFGTTPDDYIIIK